jgi:hypothetical protein
MRAYSLLNNGQDNEAIGYIKMYKLSDPNNPDGPFLDACLYSSKKEVNNSIASLQNAITLGYDDPKKLETEKLLTPLHGQATFKEIVQQADANE